MEKFKAKKIFKNWLVEYANEGEPITGVWVVGSQMRAIYFEVEFPNGREVLKLFGNDTYTPGECIEFDDVNKLLELEGAIQDLDENQRDSLIDEVYDEWLMKEGDK